MDKKLMKGLLDCILWPIYIAIIIVGIAVAANVFLFVYGWIFKG